MVEVSSPRAGPLFSRRVFGAADLVCGFFGTGLAFLEDFGALGLFVALRGATFLLDLGIKATSRPGVAARAERIIKNNSPEAQGEISRPGRACFLGAGAGIMP